MMVKVAKTVPLIGPLVPSYGSLPTATQALKDTSAFAIFEGKTYFVQENNGVFSWQPDGVNSDGSVAFTKPVSGVAPTENAHLATKEYVDSLVNPPVPTHTRYMAISEDKVFTEAEYLAGNTSTTDKLVVPAYTSGRRYISAAVPDDTDDITNMGQGAFASLFRVWERISGTITIAGVSYKAWRTIDNQNDLAAGAVWDITQG